MTSKPADAASLFQRHRSELGFVNRAQCREGELLTIQRGGETVAAALGNHCVRKPQTTLYELAVDSAYRREGLGAQLVRQLARESPHDKLVAKCPADLPAVDFYQRTGWDRVESESGKNRELVVFEKPVPARPRLATTGRWDLTAIAARWGWLRGCRLDSLGEYEQRDISPEFIDLDWHNPQPERLLAAARRHQPEVVVAGDYGDDGNNIGQINDRARDLRRHANEVVVVPHTSGQVPHVPGWAVVGYSTPTDYGGTTAPLWEYQGRDVHILGGTVDQILTVVDHLGDNVLSIDTNTMHRAATQYAKWWAGSSPHWQKLPSIARTDNIHRAYRRSMAHICYALRARGTVSVSALEVSGDD